MWSAEAQVGINFITLESKFPNCIALCEFLQHRKASREKKHTEHLRGVTAQLVQGNGKDANQGKRCKQHGSGNLWFMKLQREGKYSSEAACP